MGVPQMLVTYLVTFTRRLCYGRPFSFLRGPIIHTVFDDVPSAIDIRQIASVSRRRSRESELACMHDEPAGCYQYLAERKNESLTHHDGSDRYKGVVQP